MNTTVTLLQLSVVNLGLWGMPSRGGVTELGILEGTKCSDLPQGVLGVPCRFFFTGKQQLIQSLK